MTKRRTILVGIFICVFILSLTVCGGPAGVLKKPLSETMNVKWHGNLNVVKWMYQEVGDGLVVDLNPEPFTSDYAKLLCLKRSRG